MIDALRHALRKHAASLYAHIRSWRDGKGPPRSSQSRCGLARHCSYTCSSSGAPSKSSMAPRSALRLQTRRAYDCKIIGLLTRFATSLLQRSSCRSALDVHFSVLCAAMLHVTARVRGPMSPRLGLFQGGCVKSWLSGRRTQCCCCFRARTIQRLGNCACCLACPLPEHFRGHPIPLILRCASAGALPQPMAPKHFDAYSQGCVMLRLRVLRSLVSAILLKDITMMSCSIQVPSKSKLLQIGLRRRPGRAQIQTHVQ